MHICQIFSHGDVNGVTTSGRALVRSLLDRGHRVTVVHRPSAWIAEQTFDGDVQFLEVDMGVRLLNYPAIYAMYRRLLVDGVEILHGHGDVASRITSHIRMFGSIPTVATRHNAAVHPHWRFQNAVIAPSRATASNLRKLHLVSRRRLHIIPNFLSDLASSNAPKALNYTKRSELQLDPDAFTLVAVGAICPRKNQSAIPALIAALKDRGVAAQVAIVGGFDQTETQKLKKVASALGVQNQITLLGHRSDVREILSASDAFLSTSNDEQASIALLEAIAAGLPAFCTNVGSAPEIIQNGMNGHLIDLRQPDGALNEIERLAKNPNSHQFAKRASKDLFKTTFSAEKVINKIEALYDRLAQNTDMPDGTTASAA